MSFFFFLMILAVGKGPEVVGQSELLELVRAAAKAGPSLYPSGSLVSQTEVKEAFLDGGRYRIDHFEYRALIHARWRGRRAVLDIEQENLRAGTSVESRKYRLVLTESSMTTYFPDSRLARLESRLELPVELLCLPFDYWYTNPVDWSVLLGAFPDQDTPIQVIHVSRDGDNIVLTADYNGLHATIRASLPLDGQIVEYRSTPTTSEKTYLWSGQTEWVRNENGSIRLLEKRSELTCHDSGRAIPIRTIKLRIKDFDPDADVPENLFTVAGMGLEPGTTFEDIDGRKIYTHGRGNASKQFEDDLRALGERLKAKGFSRPDPR